MITLSEAVEHQPLDAGAATATRRRLTFAAQAAVAALIIGLMMQMRWTYSSGQGDQWVLSLLGMHWANPDWFANDWAMLNAPQPHWLFDVITWFGAKTDTLGGVMFLYWLVSLAIFGSATALIAQSWTPKHSWLAVVAFPILAGIAPLWFLGNGSSLFPIAVPGILGAYLIYLMIGALLTERHKIAAIAGMVTAVIHLQEGVLAIALLLAVALVVFLRTRRVDRWLVISSLVAAAIVYGELKLRPVAGHTKDFAEACRELIPYHCDANSWAAKDVLGASAMLFGFTALTVLYLRRDLWLRAFLMLGVPSVALLVGVALDKFDVPTLGEMSQGLFVNRLAVILFPFGFWGILAPFLTNVKGKVAWAAFGLLAILFPFALREYEWGLQLFELVRSREKVVLAGVLAIPCLIAAWWAFQRVRKGVLPLKPTLLVGVIVAVVISFGFHMGMEHPGQAYRKHLATFSTSFVPNAGERAWGQEVQRLVPPGEQILVPITSEEARMITRRAVVVDCKYGPYGGQPWQEYKERIGSLGGFQECRKAGTISSGYSAAYLSEQAKRWGADYMIVDQTGYGRINDLVGQEKWTVLLRPQRPDAGPDQPRYLKYYLLKAPWA